MSAGRTFALTALGFILGALVGACAMQRIQSDPHRAQPSGVATVVATSIAGAIAPEPSAQDAGSIANRSELTSTAVRAATPEPPASWMTVEQQRAAALAYRDQVWEQNRQSNERRRNLNAELFLIEGQDPAWAASMESRVRASMASHVALRSAELESIECRVTVCRAVVRFADDARPDGSLPHGGQSPWSAWRGAQIIPVPRSELEDQVPGFRATVYLGDDFQNARLPRAPGAPAGPGGP